MSDDFYVAGYWGPRRESIVECAERLTRCLSFLAECNELFAAWYDKGKSRKDARARQVYPAQREQVLAILEKGRHWTDVPRTLMEDLGFSVGLWNGTSDETASSFRTHCGCYSDVKGLWNNALVEPPGRITAFATVTMMCGILKALITAFEPEWGGVIDGDSRDARNCPIGRPVVDWIFYINRLDIDLSKLPPSASIQPVENLGTIIVVQDRPIDPTNPQDLQNIKMVEAALGLATSSG